MYPYFQKNLRLQAAERTAADPLRAFLTQNPAFGTLVFQVSGEGGAFPIEGAEIRLTKPLGDGLTLSVSLTTDESGKTLPLSLPAPAKSLSQSPNNGGGVVFASYEAEVSAPNHVPAKIIGLPVFDGVTTLQPVQLSPDFGRGQEPNLIVDEEPNL